MVTVALVVVNYNGWQYTLECAESVGHLDYPNWWLVLVDNGSTDDSGGTLGKCGNAEGGVPSW